MTIPQTANNMRKALELIAKPKRDLKSGPTPEKGQQNFRAQLLEELRPGGNARAVIRWVTRNPAADAAIQGLLNFFGLNNIQFFVKDNISELPIEIVDPEYKNYGLEGEWFDVQWRPDKRVFEPVGSQGLIRKGVVTRDFENDAGSVAIVRQAGDFIDDNNPRVQVNSWLGVNPKAGDNVIIALLASGFSDPGDLIDDNRPAAPALLQDLRRAFGKKASTYYSEWVLVNDSSPKGTPIRLARVYEPGDGYIDHNASGTVVMLEQATSMQCSALFFNEEDPELEPACNFLHQRVWHDAPVAIATIDVPRGPYLVETETGELSGSQTGQLTQMATDGDIEEGGTIRINYILEAYSAMTLMGKLYDNVWPDTATIDMKDLHGMDGHYPVEDEDTVVTVHNRLNRMGCKDKTAIAIWDDELDVWVLEEVVEPTLIRARATAKQDYCDGDKVNPVEINDDSLEAFGFGCLPTQSEFTITNPMGMLIEQDDVLQLDLDVENRLGEVTNVVHKLKKMVYEVYDPGSGALVVNCIYIGITTCSNDAGCEDIPTEECP